MLRAHVDGPTVDTAKHGQVDAVTVAATWDGAGRHTLCLVNRDPGAAHEVALDLSGFGSIASVEAEGIFDDDIDAANTAASPNRVTPRAVDVAVDAGRAALTLPPAAWVMVRAVTG